MAEIITVGSICQDIFFPTNEGVTLETPEDLLSQKKIAFELGAKYPIRQRHESLGGNSANVAVGLAKLGENVSVCTTVGDDMIGKWILEELSKTGVNFELVKTERGCKSDLSAIIIDEKNSDRIIFSSHIANKKLEFDAGKIKEPDWIFLGDLSGNWKQITDDIVSTAKEKKIKVAFNPRQQTIHEDVKKVITTIADSDLIFLNKDEAMEIIGGKEGFSIPEFIQNEGYLTKTLCEIGAKVAVVTDGVRGAWVFDGTELLYAEAVLRKVIDTTGAGDAFTSGFLAAYLKNKKLGDCLSWAIANSSSSIKEYGGQLGLLDEVEIGILSKEVKVTKLA
ncbi:MAG: carbohydrate kinase family protein [Candidatus Moranbacteria bacterium]|nr:carbohydrate kinase family protein [Candidatus Moranbacteria bacterium]